MRKYQRFWELLKRDKRIVLQLEGAGMTEAKAKAAYSKFARGLQKEKYHDILYRGDNPGAVVTGALCTAKFTATFVLADRSLAANLPEHL